MSRQSCMTLSIRTCSSIFDLAQFLFGEVKQLRREARLQDRDLFSVLFSIEDRLSMFVTAALRLRWPL
jgi:hypothetical protein